MASLLERLHPKWTSGLAAILLRAADSNSDETLDYEEFLNWLLGGEKEWDSIREAIISAPEDGGFQELAGDARERLLNKREMSLEEASEIKELPDLVRLRTLSVGFKLGIRLGRRTQ